MSASARTTIFDASRPIDLMSRSFQDRKFECYRWMLEQAPVCRGRISLLRVNLVARYDDCRALLSDDRFVRNRSRAKRGRGSPFPIPMPRHVQPLVRSMIVMDDPEHRRLRGLVNKAFTARAVARLSDRVEDLSHELAESLDASGPVDLLEAYARPIPTRVIAEMVGVSRADAEELHAGLRVLTSGMSGVGILRTLLFDLRRTVRFVRRLIERRRSEPRDDILTALIHAEEEGDRLGEDELVAMVFLLIVAGFETTLHLITNGVRALLEHPESLERLRAEPVLWDSAVDEIVRLRGPIHMTKPVYPTEDVELHGRTLRRGTATFPVLAAANLDPRAFDAPETFDVGRSPNHHLGFGFGDHFCLGRQLALMETRIALRTLFEHRPGLRLAVAPEELVIARLPGWHRHEALPVVPG
jgi:cytochrome P450